jgi:hypothetical protein
LEGFTDTAFSNLEKLIGSKAALIRKSLGASALQVERLEDRLRFPWLPASASPVMVDACSRLVAALCDMAKTQRRITALEKPVENEKYAMRCFLLRLGFIGGDYKSARNALLANMAGNGSFKGEKRGGDEASPPDSSACASSPGEPAARAREYDDIVRGGLCCVPPTDCNYSSYLNNSTDGQLREAITYMESAPGGHLGRIAACKRELKKRGAAEIPAPAEAKDDCLACAGSFSEPAKQESEADRLFCSEHNKYVLEDGCYPDYN